MEIRCVFPLFPAIRHILSLEVPARPLYKGWRPLYKGLTAPYIRGTAPYIRAGRCQIWQRRITEVPPRSADKELS